MFQGNVTRYLIDGEWKDIVVKSFEISLLKDACASNLSCLKQILGVGARCYRRRYVQIKWTSRRNEKRQQQQQHRRAGLVMEVWMTISAGVETSTGRRIDDGDGKRVDCTANIDTANSPLFPPPPPAGSTFDSAKATSYTNESFKTSTRCKANLDLPPSFEVVQAIVRCTQSRCSSGITPQVPLFLMYKLCLITLIHNSHNTCAFREKYTELHRV